MVRTALDFIIMGLSSFKEDNISTTELLVLLQYSRQAEECEIIVEKYRNKTELSPTQKEQLQESIEILHMFEHMYS